jgi:hypothetical protein
MLTASVGVDASVEADIRAVIVGNDRTRRVSEELCLESRVFQIVPLRIAAVPKWLKSIWRIDRGAAATLWGRALRHGTIAPLR